MFVLNSQEILNVAGGTTSTDASFELSLKETSIGSLPILLQLSQACIENKWDVNRFTSELINAGIDPLLITISSKVEFEEGFYHSAWKD